jgi:hypothetical protein
VEVKVGDRLICIGDDWHLDYRNRGFTITKISGERIYGVHECSLLEANWPRLWIDCTKNPQLRLDETSRVKRILENYGNE